MQGGVFSDNDSLLFLVSGFFDDHYEEDGINVFETNSANTWTRVRRSENNYCLEWCDLDGFQYCCGGYNCDFEPFCYEFHPGSVFSNREEPEGITFWDLDKGNAPEISGQLHVLMVDQEASDDDDSVYLKHYTSNVYVNCAAGTGSKGKRDDPFGSVNEAVDFAWDGAKIALEPFDCPESVTIDKRLKIISTEGSVRIGR
jgi:hypothetical protein